MNRSTALRSCRSFTSKLTFPFAFALASAFGLASAPLAARAAPQEPLPAPGAAEPPAPRVEIVPTPAPPAAPTAATAETAAAPREREPSFETGPAAAPPPSGPPRDDFIRVAAGVRVGYVPTSGFDSFASNDVLTQFSLEGTTTLLRAGRLSLAAGAAWDVGGRASGMRGIDTSMTAHRFTVPVEGRLHFAPWVYGFARVAPGASLLYARVEDPSSQSRLADSAWAFAADASAGASFLLGPQANRDKRIVRFWLTPEVGYAVTTQASFAPNPGRNDKDVLGADASMRLHPLALSGAFWRISAAVTF